MKWIWIVVRSIYRIIFFHVLILRFLISGYWIHIRTKDKWQRLERFSGNATFYSQKICDLIGFKVTHQNLPQTEQGYLYVGNHLGILDILAVASARSYIFVTSQEMRETPLLGLLTEMGGCVFV